jgi:hypothetical protein
MSQRDSGYERKERDLYETPAWVTDCVIDYIDVNRNVWEPASGNGKMVSALKNHGMDVWESDIHRGTDFLSVKDLPDNKVTAIVTNPPYELAREFVEHALELTKPVSGTVAMLLRTDFDHAKGRQHLFGNCKQFWMKLVLTKRIKWFEDSKGQPSFNHAWFIWRWPGGEAPTLAYGPSSQLTSPN